MTISNGRGSLSDQWPASGQPTASCAAVKPIISRGRSASELRDLSCQATFAHDLFTATSICSFRNRVDPVRPTIQNGVSDPFVKKNSCAVNSNAGGFAPHNEYRLELAKVELAFIDGEEEEFATIYTRRGSGEILGATLVAAHAGEMMSELTLAITHKVPLQVLAETIRCYPTQAEVFQRIVLQYVGPHKVAAAA